MKFGILMDVFWSLILFGATIAFTYIHSWWAILYGVLLVFDMLSNFRKYSNVESVTNVTVNWPKATPTKKDTK